MTPSSDPKLNEFVHNGSLIAAGLVVALAPSGVAALVHTALESSAQLSDFAKFAAPSIVGSIALGVCVCYMEDMAEGIQRAATGLSKKTRQP